MALRRVINRETRRVMLSWVEMLLMVYTWNCFTFSTARKLASSKQHILSSLSATLFLDLACVAIRQCADALYPHIHHSYLIPFLSIFLFVRINDSVDGTPFCGIRVYIYISSSGLHVYLYTLHTAASPS